MQSFLKRAFSGQDLMSWLDVLLLVWILSIRLASDADAESGCEWMRAIASRASTVARGGSSLESVAVVVLLEYKSPRVRVTRVTRQWVIGDAHS